MVKRTAIAAACLLSAAAGAAVAPLPSAKLALQKYCEPLMAGSNADQIKAAARADGFRDEVIAGQPMLRSGELLVGIWGSPRVCAVQAPRAMTFAQGTALVDEWGKSKRGALKSAATRGPDGSRVRAWTAPASKMALVGSFQTLPAGGNVWFFILMPTPIQGAKR